MCETPADERIERLLERRYDRIDVERCLHAVPPHEVYEVTVDDRRAVCKMAVDERGAAGVEGRVQRYVNRETSVSVPEVLDLGSDWFLAAYRDDAPEEPSGGERVLETEWLRVAGRTLATLHDQARFDRPGLFVIDDTASGLSVDSPHDATWPDALDDLLAVYEGSLSGTGYERAIADTREFLTTHADRFVLRDDAALLHGWFTPDHVAVFEGEVTCVIDFEHALAGNPEWDYWRTAVPLFVGNGWDGPTDAEPTFRDAYESVRPLPDGFDERAEAYRAFVAASHLDSLATQRGIDEETRDIAEFLSEYVEETLDARRGAWS